MIRFVNRLKHDLLRTGQVKKFLLYTFGEVFLVVVGILIALQVNDYTEYKRDRKLELNELAQLELEFRSNLEQLNNKISQRDAMISSSSKIIRSLDNGLVMETDSLEFHINTTFFNPTFNPISNDLISTGKINLITNKELKRKLLHWPSDVEQVVEEERIWTSYLYNQYIPFLIENYQARNILQYTWRDKDLMKTVLLERSQEIQFDIGNSKAIPSVDKLLGNVDFEDHLTICRSWNLVSNIQSFALRKRIEEILTMVSEELKRND